MKYHVTMLSAAERDYYTLQQHIASRSIRGAEAWTASYNKAVMHLEENANARPLAEEDKFVDFEVRETSFKTRRGHRYRILFTIRKTTAIILHIRGPGQNLVDPMDIREPD